MAVSYCLHLLIFFYMVQILCTCSAQMVPAAYVFGDSLVDVGNNNHLKLSVLKANYAHNGIDYAGKKATGRFSNGKNAADFLAEKLGLPSSPPYLSLTSSSNMTNSFLTGVSFASGGAGIVDGTAKIFGVSISLNKQIEYFSAVYAELVEHLGSDQAHKHLAKSLVGVVIGSNDLLGYFKRDSSLRSDYTPQQFVDSLLTMLKDQMRRIYNLGARKIVFVGAGAIGCCPSQRLLNKTQDCNEEANYWSVKYNEGVKLLLEQMKSEFKDMTYSFFNTYMVLMDFIEKPDAYGFTEVKAACCGLGELRANVPCLPISKVCSNRKDHVFWDLYHPTEMADQIFANTLFDGSHPYVDPINVRQLVST